MDAIEIFQQILKENRDSGKRGIFSICSAHAAVIRAGMEQAKRNGSIVVIESTSNQVNQFGGYTGMTALGFVTFVNRIAVETGFPEDLILLGGDHLGPNVWQNETSKSAMEKSEELVRSYVRAGYRKIHLDTSMFLADDKGDRSGPLDDATVASRAALLCRACEDEWKICGAETSRPVYIIGTEVPIPGGTQENESIVVPTSPERAKKTISITFEIFRDAGLEYVWERVIALVVQPGVEFGDEQIFDYNPDNAKSLSNSIKNFPGMVFEAHSTDYQTETSLSCLVRDHFCILKVGPWLTYAYREALFLLNDIENELYAHNVTEKSYLKEVMEEVMVKCSENWDKYYRGTIFEQEYKRKYSFSDRSRYYLTNEKIVTAIDKLISNLRKTGISFSLLSQYFPEEYEMIRENRLPNDPEALIQHKIISVLEIYARACGI